MKFLGTKYCGQESSICYIDTDSNSFIALQSDRVSRLKKDNFDINKTLTYLKKRKLISNKIDIVAVPFSDFSGQDAILEMQGPTYFWLKKETIKRKIVKPRYFKDLNKIGLKNKLFYLLNFKWIVNQILFLIFDNFRNIKRMNFYYVKKAINHIFKTNNIKIKHLEFYNHHLCHAASALIQYNFDRKKINYIFVLDEHGDRSHSSFYKWDKEKFNLISSSKIIKFKKNNKTYVTSIGSVYSSFTEALGLRRSTDEGKVEALAAYGKPDKNLLETLNNIIKVNKDKLIFEVDTSLYKQHLTVDKLKETLKTMNNKNFAATIQNFLEQIVLDLLKTAKIKFNFHELFVAGGVFANVILSYKVYENLKLNRINVVPYMGDEGASVGAGVLSMMKEKKDLNFLSLKIMPYLGSKYSENDIKKTLYNFSEKVDFIKLNNDEIIEHASKALIKNKVICTFMGRMEHGPRALGNRSILANPFFKETRDKINLQIKKRPWYQPLCPTILEEDREEIFENSFNHKFMSTAFKAKENFKEIIPSALHVDLTARPQFVEKEDNSFIYNLLKKIKEEFNYGVILNTSFNLHGRTNVLKPEDAITDFLDCNLDELYMEKYKIVKKI